MSAASTKRKHSFCRASFDSKRHLKTEQFGFLVESSPITKEMLSPFTLSELKRIAMLRTPDEAEVDKLLEKYYKSLKRTRRLHMRNEHSRWVTVTLDHARFLRSIGCKIEGVAHAVLFASLSPKSQQLHPFRSEIESLLRRREDLQREIARFKQLVFPTEEQLRRLSYMKTMAFLAKIG